jgi:hypothetical protein
LADGGTGSGDAGEEIANALTTLIGLEVSDGEGGRVKVLFEAREDDGVVDRVDGEGGIEEAVVGKGDAVVAGVGVVVDARVLAGVV